MDGLKGTDVAAVIRSLGVPVLLHGERSVIENANIEFARMLGYDSVAEVVGLPVTAIVHPVSMASRNADAARLQAGDVTSLRTTRTLLCKDGGVLRAHVRKTRLVVDGAPLVLVMIESYDNGLDTVPTPELQWRATHDPLTGLCNRTGLHEYLATHPELFPAILVIVDVDRLKAANDSYGHRFGDDVLRVCARRLASRATDYHGIACRWAGDEFVLVFPESERATLSMQYSTPTDTTPLARLAVHGELFTVSISHGAAPLESAGMFDTAFADADNALYAHKRCR